MITLSEENLKELQKFIDEIPTKYGVALIQFLNNIAEEQKKAASIEEAVVE